MRGVEGKVAVVTGAGSGIGRALALELGRSGALLAISDVDVQGLAETEAQLKQIGAPVKGATLIGDGATALKHIRAIGNDMKLDPGIGNCGKQGQWVPVGVGQPTLLIGGLTVGGSQT